MHISEVLFDENNCNLLDAVRPIIWTDPHGSEIYDIIIIGAGAGGLVTAAVSRGLGAKVCLIER